MKTDLMTIPGVGKETKKSLFALGIMCVEDLKDYDPEQLYQMDCKQKGMIIDRCQLYVYRCAVYYASNTKHDPKKLKWWYWKD